MSALIMEKDLNFALELVRADVRVKYINKGSVDISHGYKELVIDKHKIETCPDESKLMTRFEKKITKTNVLKSQKHTRQLCILLLISSGYTVNSSIFDNISDIFIEKCWECIQYILHSTNDPLNAWIKSTMNERNPPSFSALFCPPRRLPERTVMDNIFSNKLSSITPINLEDDDMPSTIWHRDDVVMQTILNHLKHQSRSS
jgi:hypothetical protein